jgi:hypothetical protein
MVFYSSQSKLYDPIRKQWVVATAEEEVRQKVLSHLLHCGYPESVISVEKSLSQLPHLQGVDVPTRRADVLVFHQNHKKNFVPFLLIECKAGKLGKEAAGQLSGYNAFVKAPYIALANPEGVWVLRHNLEQNDYSICDSFPAYLTMQSD